MLLICLNLNLQEMKNSILFLISFLLSLVTFSQNANQLLGNWKLESISYKKIATTHDGEREQFRRVFNASLYNQLDAEERLDVYELDQLNTQIEELLKLFYQSTIEFQSKIEFQSNGAFYNRSEMLEQTTSGEYLLDGKKLLMELETADKYAYKILKINASELVLKDVGLKVIYYYMKNKAD